MKQLKKIPFFIFLLLVFFILHGSVENFGFIYFSEIIKAGLIISGCVALLYFIIKLFIKNTIHAALVCFFISTWMLFFGAIFDWIKSIGFLFWIHSYTVFIPFMLCTIVGFIFFIRKKINLRHTLCFYLNVLLLVYCAVDIAGLILKSTRVDNQALKTEIKFDAALVKTKPNVYFLLYDEYPGYKSLQDSFAFSNDSLYHFLEDKGFNFLPIFSNYNMTFYSMSSMLDMDYIHKPYHALANTMEDDQLRIKEIKTPLAIGYFKSIGYSFTNYSIFDILDQPAVKENSFVISQAALITNKIFFNKILQDVGWHFVSGKYSIPFIKYIYMEGDRRNKSIQHELSKIQPLKNALPHFTYAHFLMPHPPLFCDSAGNDLPAEQVFDPATYGNKQIFLSYLKFANKKIETLAAAICKNDPSSIVIVMSDHGYRNYKNSSLTEPLQFDNICAIRFPDKNYLPIKNKLSNVNFFRYLFNCEFNQQLPYLTDSSIFLKDKKTIDNKQ